MKSDKDFTLELEKHLRREELLFRAKHCAKGSLVDWLAPSCETVEGIVDMLRYLGFRVKNVVDEIDEWDGSKYQWVETTSGIIVYVNTEHSRGLVASASRKDF